MTHTARQRRDASHRALLRAAAPAIRAAVPGARPERARWLGEGWAVVAFDVPSPSGPWVARLAKPGSWWAAPDLEREVRLLPLLARRPFEVAVPGDGVVLRDDGGGTLGTLHRKVPGTPASASSPPRGRARTALMAQVGRFLSTLHGTPTSAARRHGVREVDLWRDYYRGMVEETLAVLPPRSRDWFAGVAADFERAGATSDAPRVLIHGDLSGDHLLLDAGGALYGVIDFADAYVADPALDFAGVLNDFGWHDLEQVWRHYDGAVDPGAVARVRFYITVAPMFSVLYGEQGDGPQERRRGLRRLAARAAAASRRTA